jgi:hypothetical protein
MILKALAGVPELGILLRVGMWAFSSRSGSHGADHQRDGGAAYACLGRGCTWSQLPKGVQNCLFQEAVTSQGESIRPQLAVFLHEKHPRTSDPLGKPREMMEPDSLGG